MDAVLHGTAPPEAGRRKSPLPAPAPREDELRPLRVSATWCDHPELWIRDGEAVRFTFHPYGLGAPDLAGLVDWCRERGLDFEISADSWHFPHHTLLVEIATEEELAERGPQ